MKCSVSTKSIVFILLLLIRCTSLVQVQQQHMWLDIAITDMNAGPVQLYQTCRRVGASLTDMTAG